MARKMANPTASKKAATKNGATEEIKKGADAKKTTLKKNASGAPVKKAPVKKAPSRSNGDQSNSVTIRMYCQGLGDCFLLSFPRHTGGKPFRILIDCGVLQGTPDDDEKLNAVAENLREDTNGEIDLLVVTHEHWDHISGFSIANSIFEKFHFKQVWLSWAENPKDKVAKQLKSELAKKKASVAAALQAVENLDVQVTDASLKTVASLRAEKDLQSTHQIMRFLGAQPTAGTGNKKMSLGQTMDWLRSKVSDGDFCEPGECRRLPGVDGVKVYVLGPPKNVASIRKMNPTGDQGYRGIRGSASLSATLDWLADPLTGLPPCPFDDCFAISMDSAKNDPYFREHYGFETDPLGGGSQAWRRIDDDWLGAVGKLALQLDIGINNTSLALAFELPDGRVLIFPGDAQIGNWLSWDKVKFKDERGIELSITSKELLNRTVFYKVGHHGSHNATRKVGGLEEMTSSDLVAMIPTDQKFAKTRKPPDDGWKMPFGTLYNALKEHTNSRIARADFNVDETEKLSTNSPVGKDFMKRLTFSKKQLLPTLKNQPLYVEYTLPR